jgi:hypothetical protein
LSWIMRTCRLVLERRKHTSSTHSQHLHNMKYTAIFVTDYAHLSPCTWEARNSRSNSWFSNSHWCRFIWWSSSQFSIMLFFLESLCSSSKQDCLHEYHESRGLDQLLYHWFGYVCVCKSMRIHV